MSKQKLPWYRRLINRVYSFIDSISILRNPYIKLLAKILITSIIMLGLIFIVYFTSVPNPNMILIAGLVVCTALFGWSAAIVSTLAMVIYSMFFFSIDHSFFKYTTPNLQKLIVIICGCVVSASFVALFRRGVKDRRLELLDKYEVLEKSVNIDALTGVKNRYGFRSDIKGYAGKKIILMMLDIDNFKEINDKYGHQKGDKILVIFAKHVQEMFGKDNTYRYGGDEFLVLSSEDDLDSFSEKLEDFKQLLGTNEDNVVRFSAGFVSGTLDQDLNYSSLLKQADNNLYSSKNNGKDCFLGSEAK